MTDSVNIQDMIVYGDPAFLVVRKPGGLMVEPDRNGHPNLQQLVKNYLKINNPVEPVYAQHIHRLDRPVSGLVLFAIRREVLRNLSEQFAQRIVKKHYRALTLDAPANPAGDLIHWHRKEKKKAVLYSEPVEFSEKASLHYAVENEMRNGYFVWDIELQTGKFHQIRAQLASLGCPIVGDVTYGSTTPYKPDCIALQAYHLVFHHPVSNETIDIVDPPEL